MSPKTENIGVVSSKHRLVTYKYFLKRHNFKEWLEVNIRNK